MVLTVSAEEYKLLSSFEEIRKTLLEEQFADRLDRPLAYWALPNDRRLPLAFLGRSLRELLHTPFDALSATPGIGQKKIASLVRLLQRAAEEAPPILFDGARVNGAANENAHSNGVSSHRDSGVGGGNDGSATSGAAPVSAENANAVFEPSTLSEATWESWRDAVRRHRLGHEKLGRLAGSLQNLPTVIWHTPLGAYLDYSLAEIRQLKTHGEKRIRAVLEVFFDVNLVVGSIPAHSMLAICLRPAFVAPIEEWIVRYLANPKDHSEGLAEAVERHLAAPILRQISHDSGPTVRELAEGRLGIDGASQTVRLQSRKMGVTRARIYQLLDDCAKVAEVRWPEGKQQLAMLADELASRQSDAKAIAQVAALRELLFPEKYGSMSETGLPSEEDE